MVGLGPQREDPEHGLATPIVCCRLVVSVCVRTCVVQTGWGIRTGCAPKLSETLTPIWLRSLAPRAWPWTHWAPGQCFRTRKHPLLPECISPLWEC